MCCPHWTGFPTTSGQSPADRPTGWTIADRPSLRCSGDPKLCQVDSYSCPSWQMLTERKPDRAFLSGGSLWCETRVLRLPRKMLLYSACPRRGRKRNCDCFPLGLWLFGELEGVSECVLSHGGTQALTLVMFRIWGGCAREKAQSTQCSIGGPKFGSLCLQQAVHKCM